MLFSTALSVFAGCLVTVNARKLRKPTISPPLDWDRMETDFRGNLSPTHSVWKPWGAGWIPAACKKFANDHDLKASDFIVFSVHYSDCSEPWVFCRHKNAAASEADMVDIFGRMPVHMRSYIRQFMATPSLNDGIAALWMYPGDIMVEDRPLIRILAHEMSHSLDYLALQQFGFPFSDTAIWRDSYGLDRAVPSDYSRTNFAENFAEAGIVGVYDKVVPGGIKSIEPKWPAIFHQYSTYQGYLGDNILPGGQCRNRIANSETVPKGGSDDTAIRMGPKPNVTFTDPNIEVVKIDSKLLGLTIVHPEGH